MFKRGSVVEKEMQRERERKRERETVTHREKEGDTNLRVKGTEIDGYRKIDRQNVN